MPLLFRAVTSYQRTRSASGQLDAVGYDRNGYEVLEGNAADTNSWMPALEQHQASFGHAPRMATADRGFFSAQNEREAEALGVEEVALPACGRLSKKRAERQKERWFKRALRWRAGCEATISNLKHGSKGAEEATREGVAAWQKLQECLRELAELNKDRNLQRAREAESR
jgi:IS5 family transposase